MELLGPRVTAKPGPTASAVRDLTWRLNLAPEDPCGTRPVSSSFGGGHYWRGWRHHRGMATATSTPTAWASRRRICACDEGGPGWNCVTDSTLTSGPRRRRWRAAP